MISSHRRKSAREASKMREKYDVCIVGAGPSGIFTAIELVRLGSKKKVVILEKGQPVEKRRCPKDKTGSCVQCKPYCHITTSFSRIMLSHSAPKYISTPLFSKYCSRPK